MEHIDLPKRRDVFQGLQMRQIPRPYTTFSKLSMLQQELYLFSDASGKPRYAVAYPRVITEDGITEVGFIFGKAKLATQPELTIPRLESCAVVLAVKIAETIAKEMDDILYHTDGKVVLGYICNRSRRFTHTSTAVSNASISFRHLISGGSFPRTTSQLTPGHGPSQKL